MTISKVKLNCLINIGNYENFSIEAEGDNIDELKQYINNSLATFATIDPETRHRIDLYCKRVLWDDDKSEDTKITCEECEAKDKEACNSCPEQTTTETNNSNKNKGENLRFIGMSKSSLVNANIAQKSQLEKVKQNAKSYSELAKSELKSESVQTDTLHCDVCGIEITESEKKFSNLVMPKHAPMCKLCVKKELQKNRG